MSETTWTRRAIVQTAKTWPQDDAGWTTEFIWKPISATASIIGAGKATFTCNYGKRIDISLGKSFLRLAASPRGQYCRILVEHEDGEIEIDGIDPEIPIKCQEIWWGRIKVREIKLDNAARPAAPAKIDALWITDCFSYDKIHTHEVAQDDSVVITYQAPVFNVLPGGDMSNDL